MRTVSTRTTGISQRWGTSSGLNPEEDFEEPEDLSDIVGLDAEIPRGSARPSGGLLEPKAKPRTGIGLEVGKSAGGGLGIGVSIPIGGPISARGGVNIGAGGAIKGAQVGVGIGVGPIGASVDVGTDQDESGRGGCYQYVTVTLGPFSHTYGRNVCEPKPPIETPKPPAPSPTIEEPFGDGTDLLEGNEIAYVVVCMMNKATQFSFGYYGYSTLSTYNSENETKTTHGGLTDVRLPNGDVDISKFYFNVTVTNKALASGPYYANDPNASGGLISNRYSANPGVPFTTLGGKMWEAGVSHFLTRTGSVTRTPTTYTGSATTGAHNAFLFRGPQGNLKNYIKQRNASASFNVNNTSFDGGNTSKTRLQVCQVIPLNPSPQVSLPPPPVVPNPPPKKMDDKCCKKSLLLQAEILRLLGRELGKDGLVPQTKKVGFIGEEFERVETPIKDPTNPKKIKVRFTTVYELLMYALKQSNNLDTALDPQSYKIPTGKIQNPLYNRDSEQSLKSNNQPDKDKAGNKRELEINRDDAVKMSGFLQQQQYMFDALRRLEYLFPSGELSDALIAKNLLIAGAKGDVKIHNMIHAFETQMQYFSSTFGDPRELITIKDANPAIEGDQSIEFKCLSISALLRETIKFQMDTGGDVDASLNLLIRVFRTVMANRIDIVKNLEATQAIFEDTGMLENMDWLDLHLEGDPYAGQWKKGEGFQPNPKLEEKTEEATEQVLRATMIPGDVRIRVSRRSKDEKTDLRDLIRGLADFMQRLLSIPSPGDAANAIDKLVESAKFKVQTEMALIRQNVVKAASATRTRTRKRKK